MSTTIRCLSGCSGSYIDIDSHYFSIRRVPSSSRTMVSPSFTVTNLSPVSTDSIEITPLNESREVFLEGGVADVHITPFDPSGHHHFIRIDEICL